MKKRNIKLETLPGCVGCKKDCKWKTPTTLPDVARMITVKYKCNTSRSG